MLNENSDAATLAHRSEREQEDPRRLGEQVLADSRGEAPSSRGRAVAGIVPGRVRSVVVAVAAKSVGRLPASVVRSVRLHPHLRFFD